MRGMDLLVRTLGTYLMTTVDVLSVGTNHMDSIAVTREGTLSRDISTSYDSRLDVTGGIELKLDTCKDILINSKLAVDTVICNIDSDLTLLENVCCNEKIELSDEYSVIKLIT